MVLKQTYEYKFKNGELSIGLSFYGNEISGFGYKRIFLRSSNFKKVKGHYENIVAFGFDESKEPWGSIDGCVCFDDGNIVSVSEKIKERYVGRATTVVFEPGCFKIWFKK